MKKEKPATSVTKHMALISEMLHAIITIDAFERKIEKNNQKIWNIDHGEHKLMPTYFDGLKKSYEGANYSFKIRILQEQGLYDNALNRLMSLTFGDKNQLDIPALPLIPEKPIIDHDDDPIVRDHKNRLGGHSTY